ncbi:MAG: hypothetical protein AB8B55_04020 [Mariniblastus sp.]
MRQLTLLSTLLICCFSFSIAKAQPTPGCPKELLWTDGAVYAYNIGLCRGDIGGGLGGGTVASCSIDPLLGTLYFDQNVVPGCALEGMNCKCISEGTTPITSGGGGPAFTDARNVRFSYVSGRVRNVSYFFVKAKNKNEITGLDMWFKIVRGDFKDAYGNFKPLYLCFYINESTPPEACDETNSGNCTPAGYIRTPISVEVTKFNGRNNKRFPFKVLVEDAEFGFTEYEVMQQYPR